MKKIALLADSWKRLITYEWITGLKKYTDLLDEPLDIIHFNCMGNWSKDAVYNQGEYNIYTLPNLSEYDGIILDANNIVDIKQREKLIKIIKDSGVPAISLGHYEKDLYYVCIDNYKGIKIEMDHLYKKHGCRSFVFAGGPKDSSENTIRQHAFEDCIKEYGLKLEDNIMMFGTFEIFTGTVHWNEYVKSGRKLPDAFVCANDNIAVGLIDAAQKSGYNIPKDFAVTGFDNLDKARYFSPQITSVAHKREYIGKKCVEIFKGLWEGKEVDKICLIDPEVSFTESCGCPKVVENDYRALMKENMIRSAARIQFDELLIELEAKLSNATEFTEIYTMVGQYFGSLECDDLTIVIDERMMKLEDEECFCVEGYERKHLKVVYGKEAGLDYSEFEKYWEKQKCKEHNNVYMFSPIHFRDKTVGFSILKNGRFLFDNPHFFDIQNLLCSKLYEMYQRKRLIAANNMLNDLYNKDALTGLYNRVAYYNMVEPMFKKFQQDNIPCLILFLDCDNFKTINDELGHDAGDEILIKIAKVIKELCGDKGYAYRFGGDEFVIVYPCDTRSDCEDLHDQVVHIFEEEKIEVSIGMSITNGNPDYSLQHYLNIADQSMYVCKKNKKKNNAR